jgi:protein kinase X
LAGQEVTDKKQLDILDRTGYIPWKLPNTAMLALSKDIVYEIRTLDAPALVLLSRNHLTMDTVKLQVSLAEFLKAPFKGVEVKNGDLYGGLSEMATSIGRWVNQLSTSVAPRVPLRLSHLSMADFEPIEMIGKGTFGRVWLVRHIGTSRFLALKVLEKETIINSKQTQQVVREKEVLSECNDCPFIVSFVGSFQDRKRLYIVMEFVIGGELFTRLNSIKRMSVDDARFYMTEVISAISFLHHKEIIYRDLKPENIVLDALGHVRLVDFGFARHLSRGRCTSFCGSPFYIAPEMLSNSSYGTSVDIWALGVLLFELLTGNPPFSGSTANEVYRRILFSNVEVPTSLDSDSRDLLYALLDPSPDSRIGSKNGLEDVMKHRWFKGIDWDRVRSKETQAPYQPHFTFEGDTGNFMKVGGATFDDFDEEAYDGRNDTLFAGFAT